MILIQHMVNVVKANQQLDIMTMCPTENNEALKIFIVSSGKDIIALSLGANYSITGKGNLLMVYSLWMINYTILLLY